MPENPNPPKNEWEFYPDELESVVDQIKANPGLLMEIPWARIFLATARLQELKNEDIRTFRGHRGTVAKDVVDYNIESMRQLESSSRNLYGVGNDLQLMVNQYSL